MLKVIKPGLPHELEDELNTRQENVNAGTVGKTDPWTAFTSYENGREDRGHPTVRAVLREAFSGKCAYCESGDAQTVDHYIPQKPTDANDNRGSDKFTFDWENLLWSCNTCNNKKRSNMEWIDREPKLLNPSKHTDDPLCYFSIDTEFVIGHIQLRGGINEIAHTRASYTIDLLELNNRNDLVKSRYMAVNMFGILIKLLRLDGPDSKTDWGTPLRQTFCEFLASTSPFLAPIRQILCRDNPGLYKELIGSMPELKSVLDTWALPPGDCSHIYDPNADNLREEDVQDEDIIYPKESYERPADYLPRQVMLNNEYTGKDLLAIIKEEKRVVLLGDAGEGKSTELRRIASELSKPGSVYPFHPFFIELDTFVDEKIEDLIPGLHRVPDNARCIIIDGLDQVQSQNRHTAVRRIESYSREHPEVRILVSCRTAFYRTGTETHNATLDGFQVYHFLPIRDHDIEYYIEDKLDDTGSEFIGECIQYDLKDLLENPFYLVELVNLYRIENRIPGWSQLFERLLHSRMRLDREQYRTKIELSDEETKEKIISELEKLAFVMETAGQGVISGSEYRKIISDSETRNLIEHCTVWRGDPSKDRWTFEHNSFREYLAARFLAGNSFDAIKSFTAYGHGPEYTHIKPAWANSLAFLFGILEPGNSLKKELLDWVVQKSPELVIKFERDRVPENLRVRVFKQVFEEYNRKQTSLIGAINTREMARFGDIHETVEFLIRIIEQESESRNIELKNALYLIGYMNVADNYRGRLRDALFAIIPEKSHDPYVRYIVLVALANSGFSDEETADTVVEHLRKEWDTSVRSGLYYYLSNSSGLDKHIDILLEGMSQAFANNRVDIRLGDERYFLKMGICKAAKPSALLKIIKLFSQKPDYLNSTYFRTDRKKIIQNAATAYKQEPGLLEAVFELFIVLLRDYDNIIPDLLPFFELTGTKHDVLDRIFLQKADISLYFTKALCCLADAEVIKNVLKQFDLGNLTHDELWYFQRDLNFSKAHLFEKWNKKINLKTGNPYVPPEIPDYEEEQRRRREEERDLLFQKEAFLREIKLFFSHKDELNREDISGIYHKKEDDFSDLSYNFIRRRAINAFVHKDRVLLWLEQNWDTFCIHELYELLNQDETLELSTEQREWVENWCRGHLKDVDFRRALVQKGTKFSANWPAIWLWFFRGRLKLEYPEEILLDMLSFSWVQQGQMTGIIDIIAELNPEKVRKRMFENLEKGIANHQVLLNHLFYLVENEIPGVQPFVLGEIKNPERDVHDREKILSAYMEHSGDITDIEEMLSEIDKEFFWKLVKPLASHRSEKCRSKLIDILEKGSEEDKMEAVKLLVLYEEPRALEYLIQAVQTNLKISGSPFGLPAVYDMKNIDNLPLMLSLLLTLDARASESETCSMLYSNTLKALENMALNNEDSYTMINKSLNEFLRDHEKELKTTGYLNKYLDQLEESYYAKQDRTLTIDGAISEVEKIK